MKLNQIVYTETTECRDCYKCVRNCPVKSIQVKNHEATIIAELCINCGRCVEVCPTHAKKVRNDLNDLEELVGAHKVVALIAPSISSEFPKLSIGKLVAALKQLGFSDVSEVAHGAYIYSRLAENYLKQAEDGVYLSSCCPVSLNYILSKHKHLASQVLPIPSPLQLHVEYLINNIGGDYKYVFIGPCPGKKGEVELCDNLEMSLTYQELHQWLEKEKIDFNALKETKCLFSSVENSHHYATVSGMFDTIKKDDHYSFLTVAGIDELDQISYEFENVSKKILVEILACSGGCINGPSSSKKISITQKYLSVVEREESNHCEYANMNLEEFKFIPRWSNYKTDLNLDSKMIENALHKVGKYRKEDELNCGGCGYDTCYRFAVALATRMAERSMCVSYMRKLASNKAIKLMNSMPSAVVIIDKNYDIVECNKQFAKISGEEYLQIFEVTDTLAGISLKSIFPFFSLFINGLKDCDRFDGVQIFNEQTLKLTIFPIENNQLIGAVIQDITNPVGRKQQIIEKTQEVIQKNLQTVQQIAYLLGENAAESETILNSIVEAFRNNNE